MPPSPTVQVPPPSQAQTVPKKTPQSSSASPTIPKNGASPAPQAIGVSNQEPHIFSYNVINLPRLDRMPTTSDTFQLVGENFDSRTSIIIEDANERIQATLWKREAHYILVTPEEVTPTTINFKFPYDNSSNKGSPMVAYVGVRKSESTTVDRRLAEIMIGYDN